VIDDDYDWTGERKVLDRMKFGYTTACSIRFTELKDDIRQMMIHKLEAAVLAERLVDENYSASTWVPASWWQHWKLDHPRLRRLLFCSESRRPVQMTERVLTVHLERLGMRPYSTIALPNLGPVVYYEQASHAWDPRKP
jgi:hypothetical protein